jgi:hypothetical protein
MALKRTLILSVALVSSPALAQSAWEGAVEVDDSVEVQLDAAPPPSSPPMAVPPAAPARPAPATGATGSGQWVRTAQYGWVWMPYGDQYTSVPPDGVGDPYEYVYYPAYGWTWVVAPWIWGWGPWPYFGAWGPNHFGWWGHGWWRRPGHWRPGPGWFRGGFVRPPGAHGFGGRVGMVGPTHAGMAGFARGGTGARFGGGHSGGSRGGGHR